LLRLLLPVFGGQAPDVAALSDLGETIETSGTASREEVRLIGPLARGVAAVATADSETWNLCVAQVVTFQAEQSEKGAMRRLITGLTSFEGLMLAHMGLARGMPLRASSPWLPLELLPAGDAP
jgi:hypothetical protein